jgi:pyruvate kinase
MRSEHVPVLAGATSDGSIGRGAGDIGPTAVRLLASLRSLTRQIEAEVEGRLERWSGASARDALPRSAENLAAYLALRQHDLTSLQSALTTLGLSSLGRCEAHVLPTLRAVAAALGRMAGQTSLDFPPESEFGRGREALSDTIATLFGRRAGVPAVMVTLPAEAATDVAFVEALVASGMNCARINCAHDGPDAWIAMAENVRYAGRRAKRDVKVAMDLPGPKCRIETLSPEKPKRLRIGDRLLLSGTAAAEPDVGMSAALAISFPSIVPGLAQGAEVWIDDGKLRCRVLERRGADCVIEVHGAREKGAKLRAGKGVNFPRTPLSLPFLSSHDLDALPVIAEHADVLNVSFVQRPEDLDALDEAMAPHLGHRGGRPLPAILKIETPLALENLPDLMMRSARTRPTGVMIARGDLAVEIGHARLAEIQEEILWVCEAAHTPVVWATQVLDDLVKEGLPSRAETTDAAMAQRAECVMLNKGPHIVEAIYFLRDVARRMGRHQSKKSPRLPALHSWPLRAGGTGVQAVAVRRNPGQKRVTKP